MPSHSLEAIDAIMVALSRGGFYQEFLVRGSYISRFWMGGYARPVHDLDLLYLRRYDSETIRKKLYEILSVSNSDNLTFDLPSIQTQDIWAQTISPGIRATIKYFIGGAERCLQIDIATNDPIFDEPVELSLETVNGFPFTVRTVSIETAAAWKLHGLFEHLSGAWMTKTLWDLFIICKTQKLDSNRFKVATELAFNSRLDPIRCLERLFFGDFGQSRKSRKKWDREIGDYTNGEQIELEAILGWLRTYLMPIFSMKCSDELSTSNRLIHHRVSLLREVNTEDAIQKLRSLNTRSRYLHIKAYHSIPHLPDSRKGSAEKSIDKNKSRMLTEEKLKEADIVIVQEKLDGSCVCAYREGRQVIALGRDGALACQSSNIGRQKWSLWVEENTERFLDLLQPGERVVGEWLALAHGTRYLLKHEPFVAFDIFDSQNHAISQDRLVKRCEVLGFMTPNVIHYGDPISTTAVMSLLGQGKHGAIDPVEGAVWRLERSGRPLFSAKFVRKDKVDGFFLPEYSGKSELWNWNERD